MRDNNEKQKIAGRLAVLLSALFIAEILTSCSPAAVLPEVSIKAPESPAAGDVTISADVSNFNLGEGQGRIVYYLDASVPTYYDHSAVSKAGTFAVSGDTSYTWHSVTPGEHRFAVQLVDGNNSPLPLPITDSVTITVGAPEGQPALAITNPADGDTIVPGNILVSVDAGSFIISRADMGVINRTGEGHLIYYIDETPPTDAGAPATTDTSIVSTELSHLWKYVTEGTHTFSAQLVNNDDTPLDTPIVVTVSVDVKA